MNIGWNDDRTTRLMAMWQEGKSATEIARTLGGGATRNGVISKVHRLGLSGANRAKPTKPERVRAVRSRAPSAPTPPAVPKMKRGPGEHRTAPKSGNVNPWGASSPVDAAKKRAEAEVYGAAKLRSFAEPANDDAIPLMQRRFNQCAWPVGTPDRPAAQMCCGQRVDQTGTATTVSYCERHRARASSGMAPSPRDLERSVRRAA